MRGPRARAWAGAGKSFGSRVGKKVGGSVGTGFHKVGNSRAGVGAAMGAERAASKIGRTASKHSVTAKHAGMGAGVSFGALGVYGAASHIKNRRNAKTGVRSTNPSTVKGGNRVGNKY